MIQPLPRDIEERLRARMSEGRYASEAELLREAMDALDRLEEDKLVRWHDRNQLVFATTRDMAEECSREITRLTVSPSLPGGGSNQQPSKTSFALNV